MTREMLKVKKDFIPGVIQVVILRYILKDKTKAYGLAITEKLNEVVKPRWVAPCLVYGALERLEERGMIEGCELPLKERPQGRPRQYYQLTDKGHVTLSLAEKAFTF